MKKQKISDIRFSNDNSSEEFCANKEWCINQISLKLKKNKYCVKLVNELLISPDIEEGVQKIEESISMAIMLKRCGYKNLKDYYNE